MAQTPAAVQAQLGTSPMNATILAARETHLDTDTVNQHWYVAGNCDAPGRTRWCTSTAANTAAQQATSILAALRST
jgi:hypothetical protein